MSYFPVNYKYFRCWRLNYRRLDRCLYIDSRPPRGCMDTSDLRHFGPKTFWHWCRNVQWTLRHHRKNPRHFSTGAEVSARHFGTSAEVSWTFRQHLQVVYSSVIFMYLLKEDGFIYD